MPLFMSTPVTKETTPWRAYSRHLVTKTRKPPAPPRAGRVSLTIEQGRRTMKYALSISALGLAMSPRRAPVAQGNDLGKQAVAAEGGAELVALKSLAITADG